MSKYIDTRFGAETGRYSLRKAENITLNNALQAKSLYTPEEKVRRDNTIWTLVQGILAPLQFIVFLVSLYLVLNHLWTGEGYKIATYSIVLKTFILYAIMITGSIWEKVVFGKYLFAQAFFWEDVFSMLVLALHTAYLIALYNGWLSAQGLMLLALAAYAAYVVNAIQFILKLRAARLQASAENRALSENFDSPQNQINKKYPQTGSINPTMGAST
jgi:3-vinyl bacteriochlorophyllide hydratase